VELSLLQEHTKTKEFWTLGYGNSLQLVVKISERCNLACDYCYFFFGGDESYKEHPAIMSAATVKATAAYLVQAVHELSLKSITFILHGGEPLMMNKTRFSELCQELRSALDPITYLSIDLQTNAVLIDEEWVSIFEKYGVGVGVSVDGPKEYHDLHRVDKKGRGSHDRVVAGIDLVKQAIQDGRLGGIGAINVVNPHYNAQKVYDHLTRELNIVGTHFLLPDKHHLNMQPAEAELYKHYLKDLLEAWLADDRGLVDVRFFTTALRRLFGKKFERDYIAPIGTCRSIVLTMTSDGQLGPDDTLRTTNPEIMETGLFVHNSTVLDAVMHPKIALVKDLTNGVPQACTDCEWVKVCKGGMEPLHNFTGVGATYHEQFQGKSVYCDSLMEFYEKLAIYLLEIGTPDSTIHEAIS
jgi:uncharacterized protein